MEGRVLTALHVCIQQVRESHIHTIGTCTRFRHELPEAIRRRRTLSCLVKETFRERKKKESGNPRDAERGTAGARTALLLMYKKV